MTTAFPSILILTPLKDTAKNIDTYFAGLQKLSYPASHISLGFLEGDSSDDSFNIWQSRLNTLKSNFQHVNIWKRDYHFIIPPGLTRHDPRIQVMRRSILARSRNYLLSRALQEEEWVLWLDADVIDYPADIIEQLLAFEKDIVHPHCVKEYGGMTYDRNAWRRTDSGVLHLMDMRNEGALVPLDSVGGTMLFVRADLHREGLNFPTFPYGLPHPKIRTDNYWQGEIETEGFGILAQDMGHQAWGAPLLEIKHDDN